MLDLYTTTPHHRTDGYSESLPKCFLGGQAHPGCKESGCGHVISPSGFPMEAMQCNAMALKVTVVGEWIEDIKVGIIDD